MRTYNMAGTKFLPSFLLAAMLITFQAQGQQSDKPREMFIEAIPGLQYDVVRFAVKPGERVKITLTNQDDMGHNLLITNPGARLEVVNAALQLAEKGPRMDYIPESPEVLWSIPVIYGGESKSVELTAPEKPGAYPYVCTYPGHGFIMYGVMYVMSDGNLPKESEDENIPPSRRAETPASDHAAHAPSIEQEPERLHPYELIPPFHYRVFIENSGLASIAVHLPHQLSYCWDATDCRLRFAWTGGFLDNTDLWHGHKNAYAKVLGEIFYTDKTDFPLRIGKPDLIPDRKYKGYRMVDRYPEFQYSLSGHTVFEIIHPKEDGTGLIRKFRIPEIDQDVWFAFDPEDGAVYEASSGTWKKGKLHLSPAEAKDFTIIMTKREER